MDKLTPGDHLRELYQEDADDAPERDTVLVIEKEYMHEIYALIFGQLFPGYKVECVKNPLSASLKLLQELRTRIALVFADTEDLGALSGLINTLRGEIAGDVTGNSQRLPIVLTSAVLTMEDVERGVSTKADSIKSLLDGFLEKPFSLQQVEAVLCDSISRRQGLFREVETAKKGVAISSFAAYYKSLSETWIEGLRGLSFFKEGAKGEPWSKEEDLHSVLESVDGFSTALERLDGAGAETEESFLRKFCHDVNNILTVLVSTVDFMLERTELTRSDRRNLLIFSGEVQHLAVRVRALSAAAQGRISWASADLSRLDTAPARPQVLSCPPGTVFCVVDDSEALLDACVRYIGEYACGAVDEESLEALLAQREDIDVVLLDNDLGGDLEGHMLIDMIRGRFPDALIIGHSSRADEINADPENAWKRAGVEVVGKKEWNAVSGIVRRKLKTIGGKSLES